MTSWYERASATQDASASDASQLPYNTALASVAIYEHALATRGTYGQFRLPGRGEFISVGLEVATKEAMEGASPADHAAPFLAVDTESDDRDYVVRMVAWPDGAILFTARSGREGDPAVVGVTAYFATRERAEHLRRLASPWIKTAPPAEPKRTTELFMLACVGSGYALRHLGAETQTLERDNYAPDVLSLYDAVLREVVAAEPSGRLAIFAGEPGTGKTRLVRSLMSDLRGACDAVIVPQHIVADISGPDLIGALLGRPRPVLLVLEDADGCLAHRHARNAGSAETSALSALLNLSDGIVGSKIDLRIIATSNLHQADIDEAALRPGRLIERVHVKPLTPQHAARVIARVSGVAESDLDGWSRQGMTLAAAYAQARRMSKGRGR